MTILVGLYFIMGEKGSSNMFGIKLMALLCSCAISDYYAKKQASGGYKTNEYLSGELSNFAPVASALGIPSGLKSMSSMTDSSLPKNLPDLLKLV